LPPIAAYCRAAAFVLGVAALAAASPAPADTLLQRGAYLVTAVAACGNCHTPHDAKNQPLPDMELAGGREFDDPMFGHIVGSNITPDKETGIYSWSIAQIVTALRTGKRPDGTVIGPPMPIEWYARLSDRDAEAIATYLKSVKPVRQKVARSTYKVPVPTSYGAPVDHVAEPDRKDKVAYGGYLAGPVGHCLECHTQRSKEGLDHDHLGAGGRELPDPLHPGGLTMSRNITPEPKEGIGKWSDADIQRAITSGVRPEGTRLGPPMDYAAYSKMTSDDIAAITAYLRSMKPQKTAF
jgi:mono/diheme cytochrome c family protein